MKTRISLRGFIFFFSSFIIAIIVGTAPSCPEKYSFLFVLPLAFSICSFIFGNVIDATRNNIATLVVVVLYYMRLSIIPLIMVLGNYAGYYDPHNITGAEMLMVFEVICVFIAAELARRRNNDLGLYDVNQVGESLTIRQNSRQSRIVFGTVILLILVFMTYVYIRFPAVKNLYTSLFSYEGSLATESILTISQNTGNRSFLTLFSLLSDFMRVLIPTYLFLEIKKAFGERLLSIFLSLPIILVQFAFVGATSALAIFCAFVNLLVLVQLYPTYKKRVLRITYLGVFFAIVVLFLIKLSNTVLYTGERWNSLSAMLQAYFAGVNNVAACFNIPKSLEWETLFFDIYYTIPFNGTLFGLSGATSANLFNQYNHGKFQIIPCIGQAYYYFGPLLAPIVPAMMVYYGIKVNGKINSEKNPWLFTAKTLLWVYLVISPVMYNGQILLSRINSTIIPCLLVALLSKTKGRRN